MRAWRWRCVDYQLVREGGGKGGRESVLGCCVERVSEKEREDAEKEMNGRERAKRETACFLAENPGHNMD